MVIDDIPTHLLSAGSAKYLKSVDNLPLDFIVPGMCLMTPFLAPVLSRRFLYVIWGNLGGVNWSLLDSSNLSPAVTYFRKMPRSYKRKIPLTSQRIEQALYDIRENGLSVKRAASLNNVSRTTLSRRQKYPVDKNSYHGNRLFSPMLEEELSMKLIAFALRQKEVTNEVLLRKCYSIACSFIKKGELETLPQTWHEKRSAGIDWWLSFKKRTSFYELFNDHKTSGKVLESCVVCEKVYVKGGEEFLNISMSLTEYAWACESCFHDIEPYYEK